MNSVSQDVKEMLEAESALSLVFANNLFISKEPQAPANCVTLYDTSGSPSQLTLDVQRYEFPSLQIRVRNVDYVNGWNLIEGIKDSLHGRAGEEWGGSYYSLIQVMSGPSFLEWDDMNRAILIINFNVQRR